MARRIGGAPRRRSIAMSSTKPLVIVTRKLPEQIETRMMELFDSRLNVGDRPMTREELIGAVKVADVLVPTVTDRIDADILSEAGPKLRLIANFGNGIDHIDLRAARERAITVTNTPGVLTEDTADMTMALILAVPRRLTAGERLLRAGKWKGWSPTWMLGHRISGKRLGIIGMGRIGTAVARRARAFVVQGRRLRASAPAQNIVSRTRSGGLWPSAKVLMLMMTFSPMSMRPSMVADPICGSSTTLSSSRSFGFIAGSCSNTSSPAPAISRLRSILVSAFSSTTSPRAVLTTMADGCSSFSRRADSR